MVQKIFGQRLREARQQTGLVLDDLAPLLGVRRGQLNKWELGLAFPRPKQIEAIVTYFGEQLGLTLAWFFEPSGSTVVRAIGRPKSAARSTEVAPAAMAKAKGGARRQSARSQKVGNRRTRNGNIWAPTGTDPVMCLAS